MSLQGMGVRYAYPAINDREIHILIIVVEHLTLAIGNRDLCKAKGSRILHFKFQGKENAIVCNVLSGAHPGHGGFYKRCSPKSTYHPRQQLQAISVVVKV